MTNMPPGTPGDVILFDALLDAAAEFAHDLALPTGTGLHQHHVIHLVTADALDVRQLRVGDEKLGIAARAGRREVP